MSKVCFITEGGSGFGFGHVMRCRSLAQAFRKRGLECNFLINDDPHARKVLQDFTTSVYSSLEDILTMAIGPPVAVVDSYTIAAPVYHQLSRQVQLLISLDDYNRLPYPPGIVINATPFAERLPYPEEPGVGYLFGTSYCFLREEFDTIDRKPIGEEIKNILVIFGGHDPHGMGEKTAAHLVKTFPAMTVHLVGAYTAAQPVQGVNYYANLEAAELKKLMGLADVAISAGGQTLFELARVGTPTIGVCMADNQEMNLKGLADNGFLRYIGRFDDEILYKKITSTVNDLHPARMRLNCSEIGRRCVDGKGSKRVCDIIQSRLQKTGAK